MTQRELLAIGLVASLAGVLVPVSAAAPQRAGQHSTTFEIPGAMKAEHEKLHAGSWRQQGRLSALAMSRHVLPQYCRSTSRKRRSWRCRRSAIYPRLRLDARRQRCETSSRSRID